MKYINICQIAVLGILALSIIAALYGCEKEGITINPIQEIILYEGFESFSIDLDSIFIESKGEELSYEAVGVGYLNIDISNNIVTFSEPEPEVLTEQITITALYIDGRTVSTQFQIIVKPSLEFRIQGIWRRYEPISPGISPPVEEINFLDGEYVLTDLTDQADVSTGKYIVRNETFELSWDLEYSLGEEWKKISLLDQAPDEMKMDGAKWFLEVSHSY